MNTAIISTLDELQTKAEAGVARYLERRGYTVLEAGWSCREGRVPVIALDGDAVVFVDVKVSKGGEGFADENFSGSTRERFEHIAIAYLKDNAYVNCPIRFDMVSMVVVGDDRALLRHQIAWGSMTD